MCRVRSELTLHTKCRHPEAIRSGAYPVMDDEPSIVCKGYSQLRCGDCGSMFAKECDLIVHSWTHLASHKTFQEKEQTAFGRRKEARENKEKESVWLTAKMPGKERQAIPYNLRNSQYTYCLDRALE